MNVSAETTDDGGMRFTVTYGPVLLSVILDPADEEAVIDMMRLAFKEARERKEAIRVHRH